MSSFASLRKLAGDSLVYGISGIISRFLSVFLVPIYTRVFPPSEYGAVSLVLGAFSLLNLLVILGLDNSVARWYYETEDEADREISLNTFLWSCFSAASLLSMILVIFHNEIANGLFNEARAATALVIAAVNLPLTVFITFTWNLLRMQRRPVATTIFTLTTSIFTIAMNMLLILVLGWGIEGIFYAQLFTSVVAVVWTLALFHKTISWPRINAQRWKEMLLFSLPLIPGSIAFWIVNLSGVYIIQRLKGPEDVGLYQIGATVATGMALLTGAFQMAWGPFAFSIHKEPHAKQVYSQTLIGYLAITGTAAMGLALFSREILMIFTTPEYAASFWVTAILGYNFVLVGLSYIASVGPGIVKNNYAFGISMVVSAVMLIGLSLLLVPRYGKEGAAFATFVSQSIVPIAVFWHSQRLYPIPYRFSRAALIFIVSMGGALLSLYLSTQMQLGLVAAGGLKLLVIAFYVLFVGLTFNKEMMSLKHSIVSLLRERRNAIIE
jgi:O-antigen/teichoic acid export membrane protein